MDSLSKKDVETHSTIVGWLQIAYSVLWIVAGAFLVTLILGVGTVVQDAVVHRILATIASAIGGLLILLSVPGVVAGLGLLRRASWARILALVLAVFELVAFPIGTVLAGYTAFVLSQHTAAEVFGPCCALEENRLQAAPA
jgi:hypothetical protein